MADAAVATRKTELNPPKPFTRKRTKLSRFLQDMFVFLMINKAHYDSNDKKIAFVMSFMNDRYAVVWKEFIDKQIRDSTKQGDEISFGIYKAFIDSLEKSFSPYNAPGDALKTMKQLQMGESSITEHVTRFKLLVS